MSQHPDSAVAVAEVIGQSLERTGVRPGLAVVFTSGPQATHTPRIARAIQKGLSPSVLLGSSASGTLAHRQEIEEGPSIVLWTALIEDVRPLRLESPALPDDLEPGQALALMADPLTFDAATLATRVAPDLTLVGGLASTASRPGSNHLILDDQAFNNGAVAIVLPADADARAVVATGCRPIGDPMVVTDAKGPLIRSLAGRPALEQLAGILATTDETTAARIQRGLHLGIVIDEHLEAFGAGDFLIRTIMGADHSSGALAVGDIVPIGTTVQFQVRDSEAAAADLEGRLTGQRASGALAFTCNGRGSHMFGRPGHDAELMVETLGTTAVAGMSCAGEIGPVGGAHHLHGFTASVLLLGSVAGPTEGRG
ncbi:MAG: FIST N-terminal domain-containing protein [Actinomycetota bacterium]|nr:FIST N-terminal domain-containing protein [Actinomycetota bacterium]